MKNLQQFILNCDSYETPINEQHYLNMIAVYADHLNQAVANAISQQSKLPTTILELEGMSSYGIRHLLNNLCSIKGNYLEIGSWKGSTFISALYKNTLCRGISIDHQEEFKGHQFESSTELLKKNCESNLTNKEQYQLINADCFKVVPEQKHHIDIYLYDGWHSYDAQYKALTHYYDCLKPVFYYVCDDFSLDRVEKGTRDALKDLDIQVISEFKFFGNQLITHSTKAGFWNGYFVALCIKKKDLPQFFNPKKFSHCFDSN